jgi:preprotein translocase subunit SecD
VKRDLLIKLGVVAVVIIACAIFALPPKDKIHLGLDLQGGLHLVLRVDVDKAVLGALERTSELLRKDLRGRGLNVTAVEPDDSHTGIRMVFSEAPDMTVVQEVAREHLPGNIDTQSPEVLVSAYPEEELRQIRSSAIDQALEKIRNRVDAFGVSEPSIIRQGTNRIVVQLPGLDDPKRAIELIGRTAQLEFKLVESLAANPDAQPPQGTELLYSKEKNDQGQLIQGQGYFVQKRSLLTGDMLADARAQPDQTNFGQYYVLMRLNSRGKRIFARITQENVGRALAIVLDNAIFSAPVIQGPIPGGEAQITGTFTPEEARDLAIVLREGALPAPVEIIENRAVGPSLGSDSITQGVRSIVLGGALVFVFMLFYYRLSGLVADIALGLNLLIIMGIMAMPYLSASLTLPGIAGIILTVGMAVDANVLIFERIREELRLGKAVRQSVDTGFQKAIVTILDANVTTLIAAIVLFQFGSGPVKGFAVTLAIGIAASMFTAIFVCRTIFETIFSLKRVTKLSI